MSSGSSASSCRSLLAHARPAGPPPTMATPDLDALLLVVELALDELLLRVDGGRELSGRDDPAVRRRHAAQPPFFALMASVSLGTILLRSPTIPRSENSKIGAFASLLIATMFSADCMPTLCWMAPEMPAAR